MITCMRCGGPDGAHLDECPFGISRLVQHVWCTRCELHLARPATALCPVCLNDDDRRLQESGR